MNPPVMEKVAQKILSENDRIAATLREAFLKRNILCVNFISSPGSGKTLLLEKTLAALPQSERVAVLTGDIQTDNDARRLARYGFPVRQITTAGACHLDARMIEKALADWDLDGIETLFIENVGNLVCPTAYDLGEEAKIVLLSVTEGEDKPLKYPGIFFKSDLAIFTKIDLLPFVPFNLDDAHDNARRIHPGIEMIDLSATTGQGMDAWMQWLAQRKAKRQSASA
jgi:hydrogenase nickel incorporation protein HypB